MGNASGAWDDGGADHGRWMAEAVNLARSMQGWVWPNPPVGCVIVREGRIVGCGQTQFGGRPHAERVALDEAGPMSRGATLYVTLEPCCHWGKTPPCADAIIAAGVAAVHASLKDPDPRVNGGGFRKLRDAGLKVEIGLGAETVSEIMEGFFTRIVRGRPLITVSNFAPDAANIRFVPDGFDGVLTTQGRSTPVLSVRTASGGTDIVPLAGNLAPDGTMQELGTLGLTSVVIPTVDPLAQACRSAGLVDHEIVGDDDSKASLSRAASMTSVSETSASAL